MTITARSTDLTRQLRVLAAQRGWTVLDLPPDRALPEGLPDEHSALVIGEDFTEPAVLRVRVTGSDDSALLDALRIECAAQRQVRSEHIAAILEEPPVRRTRGGTVTAALVQHASGGTLRTLLEEAAPLTPGAAATILLGVAHALADVRAAGWSGAALSTDTVGFRSDGCPLLTRLGGVRPAVPGDEPADRDRFRILARTVCLAVSSGQGAGLFAALEGALAHPGWERVPAAILSEAAPTAVPLPDPAPVSVPPPHAPVRSSPRFLERSSPLERSRFPDRPSLLEKVAAFLDDRPTHRIAAATWRWLRARPRLLGIAAVPLAAALLALAVLPPAPAAESGEDGRVTSGWGWGDDGPA